MSINKLNGIGLIEGKIELQSGLHIGAGNVEIHIGGIDNPVVKHPLTAEPYIPGSSLKGKIRSLLEWYIGVVGQTKGRPLALSHLSDITDEKRKAEAEAILKLFGTAADQNNTQLGPSRLAFWDCPLNRAWVTEIREANASFTELKAENSINRIAGVADNPRFTERVPAGAIFEFKLTFKALSQEDEALFDWVLLGMKLLEHDSLGGSGSRGYGKVKFIELTHRGESIQEKFDAIDPFAKEQTA